MIRHLLRTNTVAMANVPDNGAVITWANGEASATYLPSGTAAAGTLTVWLLRYSKATKPQIWRTHQSPRQQGAWTKMLSANGNQVLTASFGYGPIGMICNQADGRYLEVRDHIAGRIELPIVGLPAQMTFQCRPPA